MSILSTSINSDTVTVILRTTRKDSRGSLETVELGRVTHTGSVHQATDTDVERYGGTGDSILAMKRFVTYEFPGDDLSQVILPDGITYDVAGSPTRYRNSRMTSRDVVVLRAQKVKRVWQ